MGGQSQQSSTTATSAPPSWAEGLFKQAGSDASSLYNAGTGGNTYHGSTVADLSDATMGGVNNLYNAGNNWNTTSATDPLYAGLGEASLGGSYAESNLGDYASGKYLESGNPYYRQRLDKEIQSANDMIKSTYSGSGRYGGNYAQTNAVSDNTTNMLLQGLEDDWNREQQNQFTANEQMDTQRNSGLDRATGIANSLYSGNQQNYENQLSGAQAQLDAGNVLDTQSQKQLSDAVQEWYATDNEDWNQLGMLLSAAAGSAGDYGTNTANSRTKSSGFDLGSVLSGIGSLGGSGGVLGK